MKNLLLILPYIIFITNTSIGQNGVTQPLLDDYVKTLPEKAEVAIGIIKNGEMTTQGFEKKDGVIIPVDNSKHIFEIGSMTKTYTGALLIDQVKNGHMKMDDSITKYFSKKDQINNVQLNAVTLQHLINHTSGLVDTPNSYILPGIRGYLFEKGNLFSFIKWKHFKKSLRRGNLNTVPGEVFEYNNSAFGLLGRLVAQEENTTWEALVQTRIFDKLGMKNSYPTGKNVPKELFVQGYTDKSKPGKYWDTYFINPAGSIKSCVADQLIWLSAHLNAADNSLFSEMKKTAGNIETWMEHNVIGNAWMHQITADEHIIWHGGATGAFRSFSAFDDDKKTGIVILTNFEATHPQMRDENNQIQIRKYGFELLRSLSDDLEEPSVTATKK